MTRKKNEITVTLTNPISPIGWLAFLQKWRNHGARQGCARPRNAKTAGSKVSFHPHNNAPSLSTGYTQFCLAGLQDSSAEEPKMHKTRRPGPCPDPAGELTALAYLVGRGLTAPPQEPHPGIASSSPCTPANVDFVPTPLLSCEPMRPYPVHAVRYIR